MSETKKYRVSFNLESPHVLDVIKKEVQVVIRHPSSIWGIKIEELVEEPLVKKVKKYGYCYVNATKYIGDAGQLSYISFVAEDKTVFKDAVPIMAGSERVYIEVDEKDGGVE